MWNFVTRAVHGARCCIAACVGTARAVHSARYVSAVWQNFELVRCTAPGINAAACRAFGFYLLFAALLWSHSCCCNVACKCSKILSYYSLDIVR
jgi:hypothetical protein